MADGRIVIETLTDIFAHVCGQARCFEAGGRTLPVCQRCFGLYAGAAMTVVSGNVFRNNVATESGGGAIFVEYTGNLRLSSPDSNTYQDNEPDDVFYVVPPS